MKEEKKVTITLNGKPFEIPQGGSLGLLALGSVGVRAWREARKEYIKRNEDEEKK
jgi:hypothetical protein